MQTNGADAAALKQPIDSRGEFVAAVHGAVDQAVVRAARHMLWVDPDFSGWPLDDPALLQRLTDWLHLPQRHLQLLASDYDDIRRRRARFVSWYKLWSHAISAFNPAQDDVAELPCVLLVRGAVLVHLQDPVHWRGWAVDDAAQRRQWHDRLDAILQRSEQAFPATTVGL